MIGPDVPTTASPEDAGRTGMPALDSIDSRIAIVSPAGRAYTILRTTEVDSYEIEKAAARGVAPPGPTTPVPEGDAYNGTARKAAKLTIAPGPATSYADLADLVQALVPDAKMAHRKPGIGTGATSRRVPEEQKNVHVTVFLYAASREADNDFHLIVGRDPSQAPETYMTVEVSGLPPKSSKAFTRLQAARSAFQAFFAANQPGMTYDFYQPPIPVELEGSLFFDMTHATGQRPGPQSLKSRMPTIWEVHPVSSLRFEPSTPPPEAIREVVPFTSPAGKDYRILKTTERDSYDERPAKPGG
jgi:hypothetical protein